MNQTEDGCAGSNGLAQGSKEPSAGDPRLTRAMEEYQALLAAGEKPDHGVFLARYPDIAGALPDCLDGLDLLHAAAADLSTPAADGTPAAGPEAGAPLGDFRIVREVGRGGMGVVYEAEQLSMGRRVALKVLPFAAVMDPRHLQRFKNEARAAGSLQHPHIVPVYFVGSERGVHYFAMQFIEGQTLAALIQQLRQSAVPDQRTTAYPPPDGAGDPAAATEPAARQATLVASASPKGRDYFRRVAEWGEQAAEALEQAHQTGIVHRDVKPGNLMLDERGHLWVTDFGLAHVQQGEANLTMTGDLIGTLRYMSPEQALANRVLIDHRTDVYSLGVTLYELLTLEPAFTGTDRQELLRQIAFEEPVAPRRRNKAIPAELETIVQKAMEKNPADRYGTAQELADDLERWLKDEPIRARRQSWRKVAAKWARRHQPIVIAAALGLVVTVVALALSTIFIAGAYRVEASQRKKAEHQELLARKAQTREATQRKKAENHKKLALKAQAAEARLGQVFAQQRDAAKDRLYLAHMNLAQQAWRGGNIPRVKELLDTHRPRKNGRDLRRWEWYYLQSLCHQDLLTLRVDRGPNGSSPDGPNQEPPSVYWSPDGRHLAWIRQKGKDVHLWDLKTKKLSGKLHHALPVQALAWSSDGKLLATVDINGDLIRIWEADQARNTVTFHAGPPGGTSSLAWSPDGKCLASTNHINRSDLKIGFGSGIRPREKSSFC